MTMQAGRDPLHGVKLESMLARLVEHYGWEQMGVAVNIRCFTHNPGIPSSLKFLRRTPWARKKVEELYLDSVAGKQWSKDTSDTPGLSDINRQTD